MKHKNYLVLVYKLLKKHNANTSLNMSMLDLIVKDFIDNPDLAGEGFRKLYIDMLTVVRDSNEPNKSELLENFLDKWVYK